MADAITVTMALAAGLVSVLVGLALIHWTALAGLARGAEDRARPDVEPIAFLFRDRRLIDATGSARTLIDALPGEGDWPKLWTWLGQRFDAPQRLLDMAATEGAAMLAGGRGLSDLRLRLQDLGSGLIRIELVDPKLEHAGITISSYSLAAMEEELAILRESVDHAPVLIWREDAQGTVTWANAAYLAEVEAQLTDETRWPLPRLFMLPKDADGTPRAQIQGDEQSRWFDCHLQAAGDHRTIFAVPADNAVRAERSLREFVQTLTKTFADLPTGLAIFDRDRRLQLFNPALMDLTGLSIGFLTARPTLHAVLDGLRELRMVPEPKDYASWRNSIATLEAEAASGRHVEVWSLPSGQTYRVTGRPHPDGAIAFLFEDITGEIAMTRRFRAELSLGAEILNGIDAAVAIFDTDGRVLSANQAFNGTWGPKAADNLRGYLELWRRTAADSPGYHNLHNALDAERRDTPLQGAIAGPDRSILSWRVRPLSAGRRMVQFAPAVTTGMIGDTPTPAADRPAARPPERPRASEAEEGNRAASRLSCTIAVLRSRKALRPSCDTGRGSDKVPVTPSPWGHSCRQSS